ncbi:MAG: adenylate/guanylate cyclase domain-containing protein [Chloroflexota bacterium]
MGRDQTRRLNQEWRAAGRITFPIRIGIHTGETLVGNIGSNQHMNYTVVGSNVNLAKYFTAANDLYGSQILVSAETYHQVADLFYFRPLDRIAIKDNYPTNIIYELMGEVGHTSQEVEELAPVFMRICGVYAGGMGYGRFRYRALAMAYPQDSATTHLGAVSPITPAAWARLDTHDEPGILQPAAYSRLMCNPCHLRA